MLSPIFRGNHLRWNLLGATFTVSASTSMVARHSAFANSTTAHPA
jgi:hypothetical protein